jgi:hypothetical protein
VWYAVIFRIPLLTKNTTAKLDSLMTYVYGIDASDQRAKIKGAAQTYVSHV